MKIFTRNAFSGNCREYSTNQKFDLKNVILLQKLSRWDVERLRRPDCNEKELERDLTQRGIDFAAMIKHHEIQSSFLLKAQEAFKTMGLNVRTVNRFNYTEAEIQWCDSVFPVGGDGTFLLAASRISSRDKPVVGLNSDPCRSEGHLCLPKKYSDNVCSALEKLLKGDFQWMFRSRVRVTLLGNNIHGTPIELHDQALRFKVTDMAAFENRKSELTSTSSDTRRILPVLALNEVFIGEMLSAKVSYFEVKLNGEAECTRVKCSGLCVCTGTGSSSWHLSMNRFSQDDVRHILELYSAASGTEIKSDLIAVVSGKFNQRFLFKSNSNKLGYTIRDLICAGVWPKPKDRLPARGFVSRLEIKSRCSDAGLVIDGGISFPFNDGTITILEIRDEDALRTVILNE